MEENYFVVDPSGSPAVNQGARVVSNVTMSLCQVSSVKMRWTVLNAAKPFMKGVDTLDLNGRLVETSW